MSDTELRKILMDVIRDIDDGRVIVPRKRRSLLKRFLAPTLLAASVGAAAAGCSGRSIGRADDARVPEDAGVPADVRILRDVTIAPEYGIFPWEDAAVPDADLTDADTEDAEVDSGDIPVYLAPPFE